MKKLILILSLASTALLTACAQFQTSGHEDAGATGVERRSPFPKSMNLG
jgi:hypothetical protein